MATKTTFGILAITTVLLLLLGIAASGVGRFSHPALAQTSDPPPPEPLVLTDEQGAYPLGLHLEILENPGGVLTIEDISSSEYDTHFAPSQVKVPNYGFTNSVYWVRFRLDNTTLQTDDWLLEQGFANTHYVDLYSPLPDGGGFSVKQTGVLRPVSTRDVLYPRIVFSLTIPPQSQRTYYLRFQSGASMTLPLTLWTKEAFLNHSIVEQTYMGIFYGVLIGLLFYNLFLFFSLREVNYLFFVLLLASFIFEEASYSGYLQIYGFPDLNVPIQYIEPVALPLLIGSMVLFSDSFLELKNRLPKLHATSLVILIVWGGLMLLIPFTSYRFLASLMAPWSLVSLLAIFIFGLASWRGGYQPSRFFILAWLGLIFSVVWVLLVRLGLASSSLLSENAFRMGYLWMAVCWSIALADRINLLKAETERANIALRDSEHRLSEILKGLPLGVVVYGVDQKPNYINRRAVEILTDPDRGIQPDISAGRSLAQAIDFFSLKVSGSDELYPLENFPVFRALRGEAAMVEDVEANQGVKRIQLEIMASPVRDDSGNIESAVVAFQDITLRKQAERALRTSETRFRVIAENNFDGIAFLGHDRKVLYVSPSYTRLVGKTAEEMIGQSGVGLVHPADRDHTATKFNELLQQPNTRITAEYRIPHKDGSWIWVETFAINLLDDPDVQAVVLNSHDISERKQAETKLAEYREHLESLVESRTIELSAANEQLQRHLKWLSALNLINQLMAVSANFTQIYKQIIEIINNLFDTHGSFIVGSDAGSKQLKTLAHSCRHKYDQELIGTFTTLPEGILPASNPEGGYPVYLSKDQLHTISGPIGMHFQESNIQNVALVPLMLRDQVYGYLGLEMHEEDSLISDEESELIKIFSTDIAQLIENSRLYEQTKALITVQERNRLARDLHDSVTQVLFSATLLADVLPQIWRRDPELGFQRLEKLRKLTRGALAEMRTMLLELRPTAVINTPLGDLLAQLTEAIASRTGLPFQLFIEQIPTLSGRCANRFLPHRPGGIEQRRQTCPGQTGDGELERRTNTCR